MEAPPTSGWSGKHAVELYVRTYTTMLQSSGDIKVESLVQAHLGMGSVLHPLAAEPRSDMGALLYAVRRLTGAINHSRPVIMGQSPHGFARNESRWWQPIAAAVDELGARDAPIYLVSSNSHSLVNVLTGVARRIEGDIVDWIGKSDRDLDAERRKLEAGHSRASRQNWLYYGARQVFAAHPDRELLRKWPRMLERRTHG